MGLPRPELVRETPLDAEGPAIGWPPSSLLVYSLDGLLRSMTVGSRGTFMDLGDLLGAEPGGRIAEADRVMW